jgi:broad specificity polyphosphatase/5'/3'-nucleotidase SurE
MKQTPPDLIISGMNLGQNLGVVASTNSGTVSAAHYGLIKNIPAIAVSIGILLDERNATPIPFPSTFKALAPAANFMVRLVEQLQEKSDDGCVLPPRTMLNVNFPVPYDDIKGIKFTQLGQLTFVDVSYMDVYGVVANGGGMVLTMPVFPMGPDPVVNSDTNAFEKGYISITVMDGDMSTLHPPAIGNKLKADLFNLSIR